MRTLGPCCCSIALRRMWRCSSFVGSCHRNGQPAMGPTKAPAGDPHFPRSSLRTPLPALNALCGWLRSPTELHTSQALENVGLETAGNGARGCLGWVFYWTWNLNLEPELELLLSQQPIRHTLRYSRSLPMQMRIFRSMMQSAQPTWKFAPLSRPFTPGPSTRKLEGIVFDVDGTLW
jgi:hypothetical protein